MKKITLLKTLGVALFLIVGLGNVWGQLNVSTANTVYLIDFDNTVAGVNNAQFGGSGFSSSPTAGQLDSDAWALTGMSDFSNLAFGGTRTTGDLARGTSTGGVSTGGVYGFTVGTSNNALGFQPGGDDWTPGNVTLRMQNQTGDLISSLHIAYTVYVRNDQGRANNFNFTHSYDNSAFTNIDALDLTSIQAADGSPSWKSYKRIAKITGLSLNDGEYYYLRWWSDDVSGSGSRDEFALDDITVVANPLDALQLSGTFEEVIIAAGAEAEIAHDATLTVNGILTNSAGTTGLIIQSNATGTGSLLHNTDDVDITIKRYLTGDANTANRKYHTVSVPLTASSNPLSGLFTGSYLYSFDQSIQDYDPIGTSTTTPLAVDEGYLIYYPDASITYSFAGKANNGAFATAVSYPGVDFNFNLVPNPYPSAIDWDAASGWTKTNVNDAIYIYNAASSNSSSFVWADYIAGVGTNGGTRYIPVGQAFFVRTNAAAPVLSMNNDVRVHNAQAFYKNPENLTDLLRVRTSNSIATDEIVVRFNPETTYNFDGAYDAIKLMGGEAVPKIYSITPDQTLMSINSIPYSTETYYLPLGFESASEEEVTISFEGIESFGDWVTIVFEDQLLGIFTDLRESSSYTFTHSAANSPERFVLHFMGVTGLEDQLVSQKQLTSWSSNGSVFVRVPEGEKAVSAELYDLQGRLLRSSEGFTGSIIQFSALTTNAIVLVRLTTTTRQYSQKVFIR